MRLTFHRSLTCLATLCLAAAANAATLTVTNTNDSGAGSLRAAITSANTTAGADTIAFNIPDSDPNCDATTHVCTIRPGSALPTITETVTLDGYTQPGASANTNDTTAGSNAVIRIYLDLSSGSGAIWFAISAGDTKVTGLAITGVPAGCALQINVGADGCRIEGSFIGITPAGTVASSDPQKVATVGLYVYSNDNVIGGTTPAARNVISGNLTGVFIGDFSHAASNNRLEGNLIGTNPSGTAAVNAPDNSHYYGVQTRTPGTGNIIGGTAAAARNVISGHEVTGVSLDSDLNSVQGNYIGVDVTGMNAIPNKQGVGMTSNADHTTIGGIEPGAGNVISGNGTLSSFGYENANVMVNRPALHVVIQGNLIGPNAAASGPPAGLTAALTDGVIAYFGTIVGGTAPGAGNVIAYNPGVGVLAYEEFATGATISANAIYANGALGIDLGGDVKSSSGKGFNAIGNGVTDNDSCDEDTGPNNLQNFPVITSLTFSGGDANISGTLNSAPDTSYRIEFFSNTSCNSSGYGEGQTFIGATNVTTGGNCTADFGPVVLPVATGQNVITATATDPAGNTSEFSACVQAPMPTPSPTPANVQLLNLSGRVVVQSGDNAPIGGFIISGGSGKRILIRGIGPSLQSAGQPLGDTVQDPLLDLYDSAGNLIGTNDNWRSSSDAQEIQQSGLAPTDDREAALVATLAVSNHTAVLRGANSSTGVGLIEIYDLEGSEAGELGNLSVRANVLTDDNVLIDGLILGGGAIKRVLFRAIGPELNAQGVTGELQDPTLELHDADGALLAFNDNWQDAPNAAEIEQTGMAPKDDRESAILMPLPPSNYTAIVRGAKNTTGIALAEAYKLTD